LSPEYLKISQGEEEPTDLEWLSFLLETAASIRGEGSNPLDEIRLKQLIEPGKPSFEDTC